MFISMADCLNLLGIPLSSKTSFNIPCPICDMGKRKDKHLNVNLAKDVFCCPKCSSGGGVVAFYAFIKHGTDPELLKNNPDLKLQFLKEMKEVGNFDVDYSEYKKQQQKLPPRKDFPPTDLASRDKAYSCLLKELGLSKTHYNALIKRGLRREDILKNGYASVPVLSFDCSKLQGCELRGVPGFYKEHGLWTLRTNNKGFFIPVRNFDKKIQGLQIRFDKTEKSKYIWLSTSDFDSGSGAETWAHFVGYPEETVYITEGPLKADIIYRFKNVPVLAVPGVNALTHLETMLKELKKFGISKVVTAFDMDYKTNENVKKGYNKLLSLCFDLGLSTKRLNWDENYKGLDDFLLHEYLEAGNSLDPFI